MTVVFPSHLQIFSVVFSAYTKVAVRHHRNAARAVFTVDQGSVGARGPDQLFNLFGLLHFDPTQVDDDRNIISGFGVVWADHPGASTMWYSSSSIRPRRIRRKQ